MPLPGSQRTIYLKTVTGRQCAVAPPLTLRRLVDAAVGQLRLEPASVRLFVGGRPIFGCCPAADGQMGRQVSVPEDGIVLVVGRPAPRKGSRPVKTETAEEEMEMEVDVGEGEKKGEGKEVANAPRATPRPQPQPQATVERSVGDKKSHPSPASPTIDDAMNIQSGDNDKGLYRFLKPLVFMLGRRGLHHLFMVARGHYGHLPESFQDHPVMVCIVDYVDRDPNRLKEILTTIQEEEPGFMRWIEAHAEFFLNVINTPPQWRDETSPIWLIRHAKRLYNMEAAKVNDQNGMMCTISPTDRYAELLSEDMTNTRISFDEIILSTETELDESSTNIDLTSTISPGSIHSIPGIEGPINENISLEEDSCMDSSIQELQMVYRSWEIAKERYNTRQQNPIDVRGLEADVESKLCDVCATFLRIMETYIMIPPDLATLSKLFQTGEGAWNECEEWFINRGDSVNAFETALGKLLFYAERELFASYISAQQRQQRRRKSQSNSHLSAVDTLEQFPILDSTTRWITVNGPSTLAHKLREYSRQESVSIVIYSQISSSSSLGQLYAYIITDGNVNIVPITSDDAAKWELKELERIYDILAQTYPPKETIKVRRSILPRWTDLLGRLYQRLITPIKNFLPLPASKSHVPPSDVGQICFIDTWTPSHIPIPFPALWNPADKASCLLQWAVFRANRPWDLIHSAEISWSNHVAKSPVITRVVPPIANPPPLSCTSEESFRSRKTMVTYVNTSDVGCASVEDTPPPPPSSSATGECKQPNGMRSGGLWQNIPWENWMRKVLGTVRAGIPTYASIKGNDPARNRTTSLFIYETFFSNKYYESNGGGNDVLLSTHLMNNRAGRKISMRREPPYNQSADLFVSHVVGRNNGAGIHRAALLPSFKVAGREPVETYMCFLKALVATDDMTAAKAYRLSLLLSWQTDCREEPWRSTSLTLYNYGGKMNTLQFLHEEYSKKRSLKVLRMSGNKATRPNEVTEEQQESARQLRNRSVVRDTADGRYVEDHGIDDIYNVVLRSLSTTRPQGEAAIFDNMIQCIERNRSALEECVEKHREGKEISRQVLDTHVDSISPPSATTNRGSSFVASMRNMITASRNNVPDNTSTELPVRSRGPPSGNQPPNGRKPPSGNLK